MRGRLPGRLALVLLVSALTGAGCTRYVRADGDLGPQAYYRTGFPVRDVSGALERASDSVVQLLVERSYAIYRFAAGAAPTIAELRSPGSDVRSLAVDTTTSREAVSSTGVVIASTPTRLTILGTDHATHIADTIIEYFGSGGSDTGLEPDEGPIERIWIKTRQVNTVSGDLYSDPFEVLARNESEDLALIGVTFAEEQGADARPSYGVVVGTSARPTRLEAGDPRRLSLGSLVYVIGYPAGFRMVTHGIVSERDRGPDASFLIDGLWNEGTSGAPILAVRGEGDGLEWVGISRAASARTEYRLVAEERAERTQDPRQPYGGPVYLQPIQEIRYGITFSAPMTTIRRFLDEQGALMRDRGYPLPDF